jgi:hypothetical protein
LVTIISSGTGAASPTNAEPKISDRNGCIFSTTISKTMIAITDDGDHDQPCVVGRPGLGDGGSGG